MATGTHTGSTGGNEGEGSRTADKQYRDGVKRFLNEQDPAQLAEEAARDVEASPGEYRAAEEAGRSRSAGEDPQVNQAPPKRTSKS
jgi:hypothetical protein